VHDWRADAVVTSGYKWLSAHGGVALLALTPDLAERRPHLVGSSSPQPRSRQRGRSAANPGLPECGTLAAPFSLTGQPSIVVPAHVPNSGLPTGVQLVAHHGDDRRLLALSAELQQLTRWTDRTPPTFVAT
jgi:Asp-tRNA(Asn)/Glu-tRNA(Gln) amidotransferase A subunit family amidase